MKDTTQKLHDLHLEQFSMSLWETCCRAHGSGGTPESNEMYDRIGELIIAEFKKKESKPERIYRIWDHGDYVCESFKITSLEALKVILIKYLQSTMARNESNSITDLTIDKICEDYELEIRDGVGQIYNTKTL